MTAQRKKPTPAGPAASPLHERKQELVRSAIRNAALDLFLENGFDAVRVEDIAARAGVSRRTFFRYFASKDGLMAQGVQEFGSIVSGVLASFPPDRPLMDLFREAVLLVSRQCAADPRARDVVRIMIASPAARAAQQSSAAAVQDAVEEFFRSRVKGSAASKAAAGILATMTLSAVGAVMRLWCQDERSSIEKATEAVLSAFEDLTRTRRPRSRPRRRPARIFL
jgi:AcrR family transcriptional regulator